MRIFTWVAPLCQAAAPYLTVAADVAPAQGSTMGYVVLDADTGEELRKIEFAKGLAGLVHGF